LPDPFEQHDRDRRRQIQATRPVHWDRDAIIAVRFEQIFRQTLRLAAKYEEVAGFEFDLVIGPVRFRRQKKITGRRLLFRSQLLERIPNPQFDLVPVIEACAFQLSVVQRKAKGFDQMQDRLRGQAKPPNISSVRRNLRLD